MSQFVNFQKAFIFSLFWALYYSSYSYMALIITEAFTVLLVTLFIYSLSKTFNSQKNKYFYFSGFILGYIALTKVIFGYVLLILLLGSILLWVFNRKGNNYKNSVLIMLIAFKTVMPYLIYTYNLTVKIFYWGNSGGCLCIG